MENPVVAGVLSACCWLWENKARRCSVCALWRLSERFTKRLRLSPASRSPPACVEFHRAGRLSAEWRCGTAAAQARLRRHVPASLSTTSPSARRIR